MNSIWLKKKFVFEKRYFCNHYLLVGHLKGFFAPTEVQLPGWLPGGDVESDCYITRYFWKIQSRNNISKLNTIMNETAAEDTAK